MEQTAVSLAYVLRKVVGEKNKSLKVQKVEDRKEAAKHGDTLLFSESILSCTPPLVHLFKLSVLLCPRKTLPS